MDTKERARNYVWSRIQTHEQKLEEAQQDLKATYNNQDGLFPIETVKHSVQHQIEILKMYSYLFKLIETDENR